MSNKRRREPFRPPRVQCTFGAGNLYPGARGAETRPTGKDLPVYLSASGVSGRCRLISSMYCRIQFWTSVAGIFLSEGRGKYFLSSSTSGCRPKAQIVRCSHVSQTSRARTRASVCARTRAHRQVDLGFKKRCFRGGAPPDRGRYRVFTAGHGE